MKKFISLFLIVLFCISLFSCDSTSNTNHTESRLTPVQSVINGIDKLSTSSTIESINNIQQKYNALSTSEKAQVTNYDHFLHCKEYVIYWDTVRQAANLAKENLKLNLKNPESLQAHDYTFRAYTRDISSPDREIDYIQINWDYSAQNGFGGYNRTTYSIIIRNTWDNKLEVTTFSLSLIDDYDYYAPPNKTK